MHTAVCFHGLYSCLAECQPKIYSAFAIESNYFVLVSSLSLIIKCWQTYKSQNTILPFFWWFGVLFIIHLFDWNSSSLLNVTKFIQLNYFAIIWEYRTCTPQKNRLLFDSFFFLQRLCEGICISFWTNCCMQNLWHDRCSSEIHLVICCKCYCCMLSTIKILS